MPSLLSSIAITVHGHSMAPALRHGQRVLVDGDAYRDAPPARWDIVVFRQRLPGRTQYVNSIKRVAGLPGEHVEVSTNGLLINGATLEDPYAGHSRSILEGTPTQWIVNQAQVFLLGDNRTDSYDSRRLGPVDTADIIGKVWLRWWPLAAWGRVR
ncbi:MAG: signal peptidase I [Chloroflexi bacterium]|nr:signal peptidase I [Chloroflexota bacterium]